MTARSDPDASAGTLIGSMLMTALLAAVTGYLYRPLFRRYPARFGAPRPDASPADPETSTAGNL
ncbi:hypothetical protein [Nucisporomicrobium flavum]|uniref:hypothetical protein n=1 Tax=Nucisporomicrobium flavum TaxID=2785915 RepID=UPI0018F3A888|nr:hypothetical protein [Nucisporomicrobium flavum]